MGTRRAAVARGRRSCEHARGTRAARRRSRSACRWRRGGSSRGCGAGFARGPLPWWRSAQHAGVFARSHGALQSRWTDAAPTGPPGHRDRAGASRSQRRTASRRAWRTARARARRRAERGAEQRRGPVRRLALDAAELQEGARCERALDVGAQRRAEKLLCLVAAHRREPRPRDLGVERGHVARCPYRRHVDLVGHRLGPGPVRAEEPRGVGLAGSALDISSPEPSTSGLCARDDGDEHPGPERRRERGGREWGHVPRADHPRRPSAKPSAPKDASATEVNRSASNIPPCASCANHG